MSYDPNGPLAVREVEEWFQEQPYGFVLCDPFMQAGDEGAPKAPLEPGQFPDALSEDQALRDGFKFWKDARTKRPDLTIGVLITEGNRPDDLDGMVSIDEFEDHLVPGAGFVAYGLGNRFETDEEATRLSSLRAAYGRRIEDACAEYEEPPLPVFNLDPVTIPGISTGPVEDLLVGMDDGVRALAFKLGRHHGMVQAAELYARHIWQAHAVGALGVHVSGLQVPIEAPGLVVVSKDHLGLYPKLSDALGDPDNPPSDYQLRVDVSAMRPDVLRKDDRAWDDAAVMGRGYIARHEL
jgi:hypothetical protein